ncbi:MAG: hypothetical protein ABIH83_00985 [Candidatus Micrarchaeota archaeon]
MTRAFELIIELNEEQARRLLEDLINPKPNAARDATIVRAKNLNIEVR